MQQGTQVSNVQWISTTILPVYSCCYYYRSFVSIEFPDWRLWRHEPWKSSTDTPIRSEYNYLMRDLFYKGMRRLRSRGIKRQTLVRRILHQTRGQGIFFDLFFVFLVTGERWAASAERVTETSCSQSVRRNQSSLRRFATKWNKFVFCWFTMKWRSIFLTFEGMFSVIVWVTHASSDWLRV